VGSLTSHNPIGLQGLLRDSFKIKHEERIVDLKYFYMLWALILDDGREVINLTSFLKGFYSFALNGIK
jgi:hypothetical protein